jgi:phosphoglycolate phosphatase
MGDTAVLCDLDGVIVDGRLAHATALAALATRYAGRHVGVEDAISYVHLSPPRSLVALGVADGRQVYDKHFDDAFAEVGYLVSVHRSVVSALCELRSRGHPLAIVTKQTKVRATALLPEDLSCLDVIVIGHDEATPKPAPDGLLLALELVAGQPGRAVFIGDSLDDLRAARSAGVRFIAAGWGALPADALAREGADGIARSPDELFEVVEGFLTDTGSKDG